MESLIIDTGISAKDLEVVSAIVNNNRDKSLTELRIIAIRVIKDISATHFLVLGYLIGYLNATEKEHSEFIKSIQLCQRQN